MVGWILSHRYFFFKNLAICSGSIHKFTKKNHPQKMKKSGKQKSGKLIKRDFTANDSKGKLSKGGVKAKKPQ